MRTHLGHVVEQLDRAAATIAQARRAVDSNRLPKAAREALWRELAGAIASIETVRLWLAAGAPR